MNRNTQAHFANLPSASIGRSKFDRSFTHKTTFNTGDLVPVYVDMDIVPGDTVHMEQSEIIRMMTPIAPVMDNAYMDFYWFFVPNRIVMDDWPKVMGENPNATTPWISPNNTYVPQTKFRSDHKNTTQDEDLDQICVMGSIAEKMGIPPMTLANAWEYGEEKEIAISMLPFRAYCTIWNEFFRDENLENPVYVPKNNNDGYAFNKYCDDYLDDADAATVSYEYLGGLPPLKVCKPHDYFTSALPGMQKGPKVTIPLSEDRMPVLAGKYYDGNDGEWKTNTMYGSAVTTSVGTSDKLKVAEYFEDAQPRDSSFTYSMFVDLSEATGATVTQLRQAFAIQKFFERDARGGTRYIESIWSHFGVRNPDYRLQRPEYLGGWRQYINMNQIVQSAPESGGTPLGTTGAYSVTSHKNANVFTKSFTEHGILLGLACVRTDHTYQQGINRAWFKRKRLDWYSPEFANLSEQNILNREIYMQGNGYDTEAFGYQEAWAEMRYMPDMVSGELRSGGGFSLDIWTYADHYTELPKLGDKWIKETDVNVKRTLAIQNHDQFFGDFYFGAVYTRPMPLYSIPGLIDHH